MTGQRFAEFGAVNLELGETLPSVRVAYQTWGRPELTGGRVTNAVLILHALTGDSHVAGPSGPGQPTPGWWDQMIGPGCPLDPDRWFIVSSNVLGGCRGTTGPASLAPDGKPWGSRFPRITVRDQVHVETLLADHLGIDQYLMVTGGSMGGMRALEWLVGYPERVGAGLLLATCAAATADQIGVQTTQLLAIRQDPHWQDGDYYGSGRRPIAGLGLARRIAHLTYRTEDEMDARFGRQPQACEDPLRGGRYQVQSYLDHHAQKLTARFDAGSYVALTEAMNSHDVGRGRGGVARALGSIRSPVIVAGVDTDRLYPLRLHKELADAIPTCDRLRVITSPYGHDAFLIEADQVADLVRQALAAGIRQTTRTRTISRLPR